MMISPLRYADGVLELLEQRRLPEEESWIRCENAEEVARAISEMVVRGAPAIGISAGYGMAIAARRGDDLEQAGATLKAARPTAVNLAWAVDRMSGVAERARRDGLSAALVAERLEGEAIAIHEEDVEANRTLGRHGSMLVPDGATVLTHCNAGALATGGYGTALGLVRAAVEDGKKVQVLADETRPYLQGARLTAWELQRDGIPVTVITDSMAGHLISRGEVDLVIVGSDRIAINGDVANKIGTYTVAVLARRHGVPFYVAAPNSTVDPNCPSGDEIPIEERDAEEVLQFGGKRIAPQEVSARHPAFDVTPAELVTAIVTESGVSRAPYETSLRRALGIETEDEVLLDEPQPVSDEDDDFDAPDAGEDEVAPGDEWKPAEEQEERAAGENPAGEPAGEL